MKKDRGFVLIETLIVSTVVASILIYIFVQFNNLQIKYNESFRYNDIDDLYKLEGLKNYITNLDLNLKSNIKNKIESDSIIIINKNNEDYNNIAFFDNQSELLDNLNIKTLVITYADPNNFDKSDLSVNMQHLIKKINNKGSNYRIIVEFNNANCATITFNMEGV